MDTSGGIYVQCTQSDAEGTNRTCLMPVTKHGEARTGSFGETLYAGDQDWPCGQLLESKGDSRPS